MFELLVPPEKAQLDKLKGDKKAYDRELRPRLMVEAIQRAPRRRRRAGSLEDRRSRSARGLRGDCSGGARRRPRSGQLHRSRPRRGRQKVRELAWRSRPVCRASSALRSAAPSSGIRWSPGGAKKRRASRLSPRSRGAIASSSICSSGQTYIPVCLDQVRPEHRSSMEG